MKIKYLTGPKCGQTSHVPNSQEFQVLVAAGIIEIIPKPVRGSREWLNAMAEEEQQRVAQLPADKREPEPTAPTYYVEQLDSVGVAARFGLKSPNVRQILFRLSKLAREIESGADEERCARGVRAAIVRGKALAALRRAECSESSTVQNVVPGASSASV